MNTNQNVNNNACNCDEDDDEDFFQMDDDHRLGERVYHEVLTCEVRVHNNKYVVVDFWNHRLYETCKVVASGTRDAMNALCRSFN